MGPSSPHGSGPAGDGNRGASIIRTPSENPRRITGRAHDLNPEAGRPDAGSMASRNRSRPRSHGLPTIVLGLTALAIGWSLGPAVTRADLDASHRMIVREPVSLGTLRRSDGATRIVRGDHGLRFEVLDASGSVVTIIDDGPDPDLDRGSLGTADPLRGFAGVADLRAAPELDP